MLKKVLPLFLFTLSLISNAQVGIGTATPNASAQLDISSTSKGLLLPRLTTAQINAIANPEPGLLVFNTDTKKFVGYAMGTATASIDNINAAGSGTYYYGFSNSTMFGNTTVTDVIQTFPIASSIGLSSITLLIPNFNSNNPGNVTVSLYTGSTPGSGTLVGTSIQYIATTGNVEFRFSSALALSAGNYYIRVHAESVGMSGGLGYCAAQYSTGNLYQSQSSNGGAFSNNLIANSSLYFKLNYFLATTLMWVDLH